MGGETTPSRAKGQSAGVAHRLMGQELKDEFHRRVKCNCFCRVTRRL